MIMTVCVDNHGFTLLQRSPSEQQAMLLGWKWGTRWPLHWRRPCKDDHQPSSPQPYIEGLERDDDNGNDVYLFVSRETAIGAFRYKRVGLRIKNLLNSCESENGKVWRCLNSWVSQKVPMSYLLLWWTYEESSKEERQYIKKRTRKRKREVTWETRSSWWSCTSSIELIARTVAKAEAGDGLAAAKVDHCQHQGGG